MSHLPSRTDLFCNRTINMRSIEAIGFDMDYTLIHYDVAAWEERAFAHLREGLINRGWPVAHLQFDPDLAMQGLIIDTQEGNVVKANRFGYIKRSFHGTRVMPFSEQRELYSGVLVDLNDTRWKFMNTQFSISELCMFMQLVDLLDEGKLPPHIGYENLYRYTRFVLDEAHLIGVLKSEIINNPQRFVVSDDDLPLALLDQKEAGKRLLLITNSEWSYAAPMLSYVFDDALPGSMTWRDLFHFSIFGSRKPAFFSSNSPAFEIVTEDGMLREHKGLLQEGGIYVGGNATLVEKSLKLKGERILYVGDHIFSDVKVSKNLHRWRTALVLRELEDEIEALGSFAQTQDILNQLMAQKEDMEAAYSALRLENQRNTKGYGPQTDRSPAMLAELMQESRSQLVTLDAEISGHVQLAGQLHNPNWGLLMRAGNDKSHFARQVEQSADIYTSRVSNFLQATPFVYLRSSRGSLPHSQQDVSDFQGIASASSNGAR